MSWKTFFAKKERTPREKAKNALFISALIAPVYVYLFVMFTVFSQDIAVMEVITKELLIQAVIAFSGLLMVFKLLDIAEAYYNYRKAKKMGDIGSI